MVIREFLIVSWLHLKRKEKEKKERFFFCISSFAVFTVQLVYEIVPIVKQPVQHGHFCPDNTLESFFLSTFVIIIKPGLFGTICIKRYPVTSVIKTVKLAHSVFQVLSVSDLLIYWKWHNNLFSFLFLTELIRVQSHWCAPYPWSAGDGWLMT